MDRNYADWYTPELYSFLPALGIPSVVATVHRLVADVNRRPVEPLAAPWPRGVVATTSARHEPMYADPLSDADLRARVALAHTPYHEALDGLVREALDRFEAIVLLDLHSFGMPLGVDVVVGDGRSSTASEAVMGMIEGSFGAHGLSVRRNDPFSGGWVTGRFREHRSVHAVVVEVNQRVYLDPEEIDRDDWRRPSFDEGRVLAGARRLRAVLETLIDRIGPGGPPLRDLAA